MIDNSDTDQFTPVQMQIYQGLVQLLSKMTSLYIYQGVLCRRLREYSNDTLSIEEIEANLMTVVAVMEKEKLLSALQVLFTEDQDYTLDQEILDEYEQTGILYHPETGEAVDDEEGSLVTVFTHYSET